MSCDVLKVEGTDIRDYCTPAEWRGVYGPMAPRFTPVEIPGVGGVYDHGGTLVGGRREVAVDVSVYSATPATSRGLLRDLLALCLGTPSYSPRTLRFETDFGDGVEFVEVEARFMGGSPADPAWSPNGRRARLTLPWLVVDGDIDGWALVTP